MLEMLTTNRIIDHITQVVSSVAATRQTTPSSNSNSNNNIQSQSTQPGVKRTALNSTICPAPKAVNGTLNRPTATNDTMENQNQQKPKQRQPRQRRPHQGQQRQRLQQQQHP